MSDLPPPLLASFDQGLSTAVDNLLAKAAEHDGKDGVEAVVDLMSDLLDTLSTPALAAAAACLALRMRRAGS